MLHIKWKYYSKSFSAQQICWTNISRKLNTNLLMLRFISDLRKKDINKFGNISERFKFWYLLAQSNVTRVIVPL